MAEIKIKRCVVGMISTNCYMVYHDGEEKDEKPCVIIDPGDNAQYLARICQNEKLKPQAILLTHGHFDHIMAADELRRIFQVPICIGEKEQALLSDPDMNVSKLGGEQVTLTADRLLRDGESLDFLGEEWKVLFTPGHTGGGVCYYLEKQNMLFSGDTLFEQSVGRTDLPTGSAGAIVDSVVRVLFALPDQVMVYPGHGDETSIGYEKQHNPVAHYAGR